MLLRFFFPHFHIYYFLKVAAPSDFGNNGALEIIWEKNSPVCPWKHSESLTNSKMNQKEKKQQNPQTFVFRLNSVIYPAHKTNENLETISFCS